MLDKSLLGDFEDWL